MTDCNLAGRPLAVLILAAAIAGCGAESMTDDTSSASGGGGCNFTDELSASEREAANACGSQASSQVAVADGLLDSAIRNCQAGNVDAANEIYDTQYLVQVDRTERVIDEICGGTVDDGGGGGGGGGIEDPSTEEYYNLCIGQDTEFYYAGCYGPVQYSDNSCGGGDTPTYNGKYDSQSGCIDARDNYLDNVGG